MKLLCGPQTADFPSNVGETLRVILYGQPNAEADASAGAAAFEEIRRAKLAVAPRAWDLLSIALSVVTADLAALRGHSPDGWTREFEIEIAVADPDFWNSQKAAVEKTLSFLTTDVWRVSFRGGGLRPPEHRQIVRPIENSIVLLSGGLDSLVGAVDLVVAGQKPFAISQIVRGDASKQKTFAASIGNGLRHLQLNHTANPPGEEEPSQRARSLIFLAFAAVSATTLKGYHDGGLVPLFVCENGFIAINPPLTGGRLGSLSTRTAHPEFLARFQELLDAAGIRVRIDNPYQFMTKGEMLRKCADQSLLTTYAVTSTSCGRYQRFNYKHCGRCVPCQVRRAAFLAWGVGDTTEYVYGNLGQDDAEHASFDDVRCVAMAIASVATTGVDTWLAPTLSYPRVGERARLKSLAERGLQELAELHKVHGVK